MAGDVTHLPVQSNTSNTVKYQYNEDTIQDNTTKYSQIPTAIQYKTVKYIL